MSEDVSVEILLVVISLSTSLDLAVEPIVRSCLALLGVIAHLLPVLEDELTAGPPVRAADVLTDLLTQLLYLLSLLEMWALAGGGVGLKL